MTTSWGAWLISLSPSLRESGLRRRPLIYMYTIRAAIYARVSTKPQAGEDKVSIPDQLRECRKFIEQQEDWHYAGEFVDPGISANTIERPGLKKLLSSLGQFDVVLAWDFDRFYRERRSVAGFILVRSMSTKNRSQASNSRSPSTTLYTTIRGRTTR